MLVPAAVAVAFSLTASPATAPAFETGLVVADGLRYSYPVVTRTGRGNLFLTASRFRPVDGGETAITIVGAFSHDGGRTWTPPQNLIATGQADYDPNIVVDGKRILVFSTTTPAVQKVIDHSEVWMTSTEDEGKTWTEPARLPFPFAYLVGKRHIGVRLRDGSLAMPFSWDVPAQEGHPATSEGGMDLKSGVLISTDHGRTWTARGEMHAVVREKTRSYGTGGVCEPAMAQLADGTLYMLLRTASSHLYEARSSDAGRTWTQPAPSPLSGFNTPAALWRMDRSREIVCVWNNSPAERWPLTAAVSADGGRTWSPPRDIARVSGEEVSYPGVTQAKDGMIVAVWQHFAAGGRCSLHWARFHRDWLLHP